MSAFIQRADYAASIRENRLDQITEYDDNKLDQAETFAIAFMKGFLSSRYDVDAIFSATDDDRDPVILMYAIEIALYQLHCLINPRKIPDFRIDRYEKAEAWLKMVAAQKINPNLPLHASPDT